MTGETPARAVPFDLAVVGTGILGAMVAYRAMLRHPGWRILAVDRQRAGAGATGMSAGFDVPTGRCERQRSMAARSTAFYAELAGRRPASGRRAVDVFWLVSAGGRQALADTLHGSPPEEVDAARAKELAAVFPGLTPGPESVLLATGPGSRAVPAKVARDLLREVRDTPGNAVRDGWHVRAVEPADDGLALLASDGTGVTARRVVVATGPWAVDGPYGDRALAHGLRTKKVVAFHVQSPPPAGAPALVFEDEDAFLLPQPEHGRWLLSITSQEWDVPATRADRLVVTAEDRDIARAVLDRHVPGFGAGLAGGQVHCDSYPPDGLPLVTRADDTGRAVLAVGGAGAGYRLAPAVAEDALNLFEPEGPDTA
ncbi:NAD(P)/FAD-dependent oxidoreductase [Streptomyces flavidovirens]|uniref:NAD(P)/FAD-dependent oxidoreductase n=1 Tax=Streptomyces flavidovirens TaxID=67298 RepID=A0ABW6RG82_9ACTN